jgi:FkbM family methyltransferase
VSHRPLSRIASDKFREISAFWRDTQTPLALTLDTLRLKSAPFVAVSSDGIKLELRPRAGESFTFYENLVRRDYVANGIRLHPGDTVVDIGANIGSFAVLAASIVGPSGRVIAFEPVSATFVRLQENVALNGFRNVEMCREGVEAQDGTIELRLGTKSALAGAYFGGETTSVETVPCLSIQHVFDRHGIDRIHLLKIDCEGGEYGIFRSLTPELAERIDQIAMEAHRIRGESLDGLAARIEALGFSVARTGLNWMAFNRRRSVPSLV